MKTRHVFVALAIGAGLGILLAGCAQSDEQAETGSRFASAGGLSVTCEGNGSEMECAVTCSGADGTSSEYFMTCEGQDGSGECTVTCEGADGTSSEYFVTCEGHDGSGECTVTCEGAEGGAECTVTCEGAHGKREFTITCDGKTVACEHADGRECTCEAATTLGSPGTVKTADAGSSSPRSGASTVTEGSGR